MRRRVGRYRDPLGRVTELVRFHQRQRQRQDLLRHGQPATTAPKAKRDPIHFLITDWPGRSPKTKSEPEVIPGYQYKVDSTVTATIGKESFELFTKNDGGAGAAWVRHRADEIKLIEAMKHGQKLVITGISLRGTKTTDTYALAGLQDALDKIHAACGFDFLFLPRCYGGGGPRTRGRGAARLALAALAPPSRPKWA